MWARFTGGSVPDRAIFDDLPILPGYCFVGQHARDTSLQRPFHASMSCASHQCNTIGKPWPVDDAQRLAYCVARPPVINPGAAMTFGDWLTHSFVPFLLAVLPVVLW